MARKIESTKLNQMRGNWFRVVRHCPDKTKTYVHDLHEEVTQIACYLARGIKSRVCHSTTIFDDRDRQWVSCCVITTNATKLNKKIIDYDGDMNFSDVSFRFKNTRIGISRNKLISYSPDDFIESTTIRKRRGG